MERKQWLETFLKLADNAAPAIEYRKRLRIMSNALGPHVKRITEYRKELQDIYDYENEVQAQLYKQEKLKKDWEQKRQKEKEYAARTRKLESGLQKRKKNVHGKSDGTKDDSV